MTLIVGIWCPSGVVIGADSAATFSAPISGPEDLPTIVQPYPSKIEIVDHSLVVASTGSVGLGQRFIENATNLWRTRNFRKRSTLDIGRAIAKSSVNDFASTKAKQGHYGALVSCPIRKSSPALIEFESRTLQPHVKDSDIWYAAMGSGQLLADPLLGFVREAIWSNQPPHSCHDAMFGAMLVLSLSCRMAPSGVRGPVKMAVVERANGETKARHLDEDELDELQEHVRSFMSKIGGLVKQAPPIGSPPSRPDSQGKVDLQS